MGKHDRTVRIDPELWVAIQQEAGHADMTASEFIRGASAARVGWSLARRQDAVTARLEELWEAGDRFNDAWPTGKA